MTPNPTQPETTPTSETAEALPLNLAAGTTDTMRRVMVEREDVHGSEEATYAELAALLAALPDERRASLLAEHLPRQVLINTHALATRATTAEAALAEKEAELAGVKAERDEARAAFTRRSMADTDLVSRALAALRPLVGELTRFGYEPSLLPKKPMPDDPTRCEFCWKPHVACACVPPAVETPGAPVPLPESLHRGTLFRKGPDAYRAVTEMYLVAGHYEGNATLTTDDGLALSWKVEPEAIDWAHYRANAAPPPVPDVVEVRVADAWNSKGPVYTQLPGEPVPEQGFINRDASRVGGKDTK
jgi:hypothetical protein